LVIDYLIIKIAINAMIAKRLDNETKTALKSVCSPPCINWL